MQTLLHLLAPGEKVPPGVQVSFVADGLALGWAFFLFVVLTGLVVLGYRRYAAGVGWLTRTGLVALRALFITLLILMLVQPALILTTEQTVRRPFCVLIDQTQSMGLVDLRTAPADITRAALATGEADPGGGIDQPIASPGDNLRKITRAQLLEALAANGRLDLWAKMQARADLTFYGFGRQLTPLGSPTPAGVAALTAADFGSFFHRLTYDQNLTALGDGLRDLLDQERGQPLAGVLVITDGANNSGSSPLEAAATAREDGVPLFLYGVGVTSPPDIMVAGLNGPAVVNVKEKMPVTVRLRAQGMIGKRVSLQLQANGEKIDEQPIEIRADGEQEVTLNYTPAEIGEVELQAVVPPLPEEVNKLNNSATLKIRVANDKIRVLLVEGEPRWDFQYLLAMLQRDRRVTLKAVLLKGDDLSGEPGSPFLPRLPEDKGVLDAFDVIMIGDVDPNDIGPTRMQLLNDWVSKIGGGIVFLSGPHFDPNAYANTPLGPLLPVEPGANVAAASENEPTRLKLTAVGEGSPLLALSDGPQENLAIWDKFPPVNWTATVGLARPGAQVLLVDPTPQKATRDGPMPVLALQPYGLGQCLYVGFDETYRWRARKGEAYYTRIWGQLLQALTGQHGTGNALTQLRSDRPQYLTGDRIKISARLFQPDFSPYTDPEVSGTLTIATAASANRPAASHTTELRLEAVPDRPGEYRAETVARTAGTYSFATVHDPSAVLKLNVEEPKIELLDVAMNEKLLRAMATESGGRFLREEDLAQLPSQIHVESSDALTTKRIPLAVSPLVLGLLVVAACAEWLWRRRLELK